MIQAPGLHSKSIILALHSNIRPGYINLAIANRLAYNTAAIVTNVKSLIVQAPTLQKIEIFQFFFFSKKKNS
jgi:hypothetical protein